MKTTLLIPDPLFRALKRRAVQRRQTLSAVVTECLQRGLSEKPAPRAPRPLPTFSMGEMLVDVADRDALYKAMEGR